ncbi:Transcriptional coactivator Hfi1/Transcriptional adapter 1 [Sesbania bispinosa]|nr:Transcriptional coactivator Hfi1/Transcriptional adapter 1 [Sesbania bispinosa]
MTISKRSYTRIDTFELKALIARKFGQERADKYFYQLGRFFSSKISKSEFDKICIKTIGRENIPLHNKFIRAILKNACLSKVPPLRASSRIGSALSAKDSNGQQSSSVLTPNGDAFRPSLRRGGSLAARDRKIKGRQNALGTLGKPQGLASEELIYKTQEQQSPTELNSLGSRPPISVEEGEEVEQMAGSPSIQSRSPVTAPLGIFMNFGGRRRLLSNVSLCSKYYPETCHSNGVLPDTGSLRNRLEQKLEKEGLTATVDSVNLLNNALDSYLKRLIESCMGLAGSRSGNEHQRQQNGQSTTGSNVLLPGRCMQTATQSASASVLDFRLAMELNPQLLGPDWPIQLEKICIRASEE